MVLLFKTIKMDVRDKIKILLEVLQSDIPFSVTTYDKLKERLADLLLTL